MILLSPCNLLPINTWPRRIIFFIARRATHCHLFHTRACLRLQYMSTTSLHILDVSSRIGHFPWIIVSQNKSAAQQIFFFLLIDRLAPPPFVQPSPPHPPLCPPHHDAPPRAITPRYGQSCNSDTVPGEGKKKQQVRRGGGGRGEGGKGGGLRGDEKGGGEGQFRG